MTSLQSRPWIPTFGGMTSLRSRPWIPTFGGMTSIGLWRLVAVSVVITGTPLSVSAQVSMSMRAQDLGINAAIGAATATVWSLARGRGFKRAVLQGLIGGATIGVGRQVAASPFSGSGFAGRELSAVGISALTSAGSDHTTLSFPVGPVELQLTDGKEFDWRVNATYAVAAVVNSVSRTTHIDPTLSLYSGTFVFRDNRETLHTSNGEARGSEFFGGIKIAKSAFTNSNGTPNVLYHENVHVLQDDYLAFAVANPIERSILNQTSIGRRITRHIDVGLLSLGFNGLANSIVPYNSRPWEREAYALTPRRNY